MSDPVRWGRGWTHATRRLTALASVACLAGCGVLAGRSAPLTHYDLRDAEPTPARLAQPRPGTLLLRETLATARCQDTALIFSPEAGRGEPYQYARWSEAPSRQLHQLLKTRLDALGLFEAVASQGSGVAGDWQLNTRLLECHHDTRRPPGVVRLTLEVELVHRDTARLAGRARFSAETPVAHFQAQSAAQSFAGAAGDLLTQVTDWLQAQPATPAR